MELRTAVAGLLEQLAAGLHGIRELQMQMGNGLNLHGPTVAEALDRAFQAWEPVATLAPYTSLRAPHSLPEFYRIAGGIAVLMRHAARLHFDGPNQAVSAEQALRGTVLANQIVPEALRISLEASALAVALRAGEDLARVG